MQGGFGAAGEVLYVMQRAAYMIDLGLHLLIERVQKERDLRAEVIVRD